MPIPLPLLIGAGATAAGFAGQFFKKKKKPKRLPTMSAGQEQLFNQGIQAAGGGGGPLADLYAPYDMTQGRDVFERNIAEPALERFREQVIPGITGQFRQGNLGESSYHGDALARSGRDVQRNLDNRMAQYLQEGEEANKNRRMQGVQNLYGQQPFAYEQQEEGDPWSSLMQGGSNLLGNYAGMQSPYGGGGGQQRRRQPYQNTYQRQQLPGFNYNPGYGY